jgi:YesN/AraC family two-component response regulator
MAAQEIARELGYSDPYFFYRQFKQKTGVTAVGYRRKWKQRAR